MQQLNSEGVDDDPPPWLITSEAASGGNGWEIEEVEEPIQGLSDTRNALISAAAGGDEIYVAVGKNSSSMEALCWALKHVARPSSFVYLIHVFPEVLYIPTPRKSSQTNSLLLSLCSLESLKF